MKLYYNNLIKQMNLQIIKTCIEMLEQRNYTILSNDIPIIIAQKPDNTKMCCILMEIYKFDVNRLKEYIYIITELDIKHCVAIYKNKITSKAKQIIENMEDIYIELFSELELSYNITKSNLIPKHVRLSKQESKDFKLKYGNKYPIIRMTDPISRFYDYQKGDIIQIVHNNGYVSHCIVK